MKRAITGNDAKRKTLNDQRLQTAAKRAMKAHSNVKRLATRLTQELDSAELSGSIVMSELSPEDSMVVAVDKVITSQSATTSRNPKTTLLNIASRTQTVPGMVPILRAVKK